MSHSFYFYGKRVYFVKIYLNKLSIISVITNKNFVSVTETISFHETGVTWSNNHPLYPDASPFLMLQNYPTLEL